MKHGRCWCMQNNQPTTKSHVELEDRFGLSLQTFCLNIYIYIYMYIYLFCPVQKGHQSFGLHFLLKPHKDLFFSPSFLYWHFSVFLQVVPLNHSKLAQTSNCRFQMPLSTSELIRQYVMSVWKHGMNFIFKGITPPKTSTGKTLPGSMFTNSSKLHFYQVIIVFSVLQSFHIEEMMVSEDMDACPLFLLYLNFLLYFCTQSLYLDCEFTNRNNMLRGFEPSSNIWPSLNETNRLNLCC